MFQISIFMTTLQEASYSVWIVIQTHCKVFLGAAVPHGWAPRMAFRARGVLSVPQG